MDEKEQNEIYRKFNDQVNMSPSELEKWLQTDKSKTATLPATRHSSPRAILKKPPGVTA